MAKEYPYPKTVEENFAYRAKMLYRAKRDPEFRSAVKAWCKEDILFWINCTCWTFDQRAQNQRNLGYDSAHLLFLTFPFQDDYILSLVDDIQNERDSVTEKSRDMGASWMIMLIMQWFWQFHGAGNDFLVGSRKENFVDHSGNMDALFPKMVYQLKRQPEWLLPEGFSVVKHATYMKIINPETGSTITGESNNKYFGTGGRRKAVVFDEFSKWEHTDESAWQSASDVTNCKIAISSANGRTNHFYKLRAGQAGEIRKHRLHWSLHPLKDQQWYEGEKKRRSKQDVAAELDIDYTASVSNKAWENFKYDVHVTSDDLYSTDLPIILSCDFNIEPMSWILIHDISPMTCIFDELVDNERTRTEYHIQEFVKKYASHQNKVIHLYGDATGKSGHTASITSNYEIIKNVLQDNGWDIQDYVPRSNPPVSARLDASNKRLSDYEREGESFVLIHEKCKGLIDALELSKRKGDGIDKKGNVEHAGDAWSYYEAERFPISKGKSTQTKLTGL